MTDAPDSLPDTTTNPNAGPAVRWRTLLVIVAAILALIYAALLLARWALGDDTPPLTEDALAAAEERWQANGPASYDMELELGGAGPGIVRLEVRDGVPVAVERDGRMTPERTWNVWTVSGQFSDTLSRDLEIAADPAGQIGAAPGTHWYLHARFHPKYGYPQVYRRTVVPSGPDVSWEVRRFEVID